MRLSRRQLGSLGLGLVLLAGCGPSAPRKPRLSLFVGVDISQSFLDGPFYETSMDFLAHYLYAHLNGLGGAEVPNTLFVGPIGGARADEAKTFHPIQEFQDKSVEDLATQLRELFPRKTKNPTTDFNAFFEAVAQIVKSRSLILRPISVVMLTDGKPYVKEQGGKVDFRHLQLKPLEKLARNVTVRVFFTDAVTARSWQTEVPRRNIRLWTQDAEVMAYWKDPKILQPGARLETQDKFLAWLKDNVDFGVRARRVE